MLRAAPRVESRPIRHAPIDPWLPVPPFKPRRNQFTVPGEAERRYELQLAEARGTWGAAWVYAWIEIDSHIRVCAGRCETCRANQGGRVSSGGAGGGA